MSSPRAHRPKASNAEPPAAERPGAAPRRTPTQRRSRERLDRILAAATSLIAGKGSDRVTMSEVASLAEISIGSLYQYFPDKGAIIRTLAEQRHARSRQCVEEALGRVQTLPELRAAFADLFDQYYRIFLAEPAMRDIWSGMQGDKQLMALELAEGRACGAMLAASMRRVQPDADPKRTAATAFLIWQLGEAAMRLAISLGRKEGDALVDAFKRMVLREIAGG